jgi:hypothetical protein
MTVALFQSLGELRAMLTRIEIGCPLTAGALRDRIAAQKGNVAALGRFAMCNAHDYDAAQDLVVQVASRMRSPERLELALLALEVSYLKCKSRADRGRSGLRYAPFWAEFDQVVKRHLCSTADQAYEQAASRTPAPHPKLSVAAKRWRALMDGNL